MVPQLILNCLKLCLVEVAGESCVGSLGIITSSCTMAKCVAHRLTGFDRNYTKQLMHVRTVRDWTIAYCVTLYAEAKTPRSSLRFRAWTTGHVTSAGSPEAFRRTQGHRV